MTGITTNTMSPTEKIAQLEQRIVELEARVALPETGRERCPVCFANDWEIDYMRTADGEMRVDICAVCGWPPPAPHGVREWRDKWLTLGETEHSHPGPSHLRHIALLLDLLDPRRA